MHRFRPPLLVVAVVLLGLLAVLATLQYRWLGRISEAEQERTRAALAAGAREFSEDVDRELTRAFLLFQAPPLGDEGSPDGAAHFALRYDRWAASSRFPKLLKDLYLFIGPDGRTPARLERFDPTVRTMQVVEWPESMANWREHVTPTDTTEQSPTGNVFVRRMPLPIWERVPALVVPMPMLMLSATRGDMHLATRFSYAVLTIDRDYLRGELLPSLSARHFSRAEAGLAYKVAVVSQTADGGIVYQSTPSFAPRADSPADASADLFQVRTQDFSSVAAEVRRFTAVATVRPKDLPVAGGWVARHDQKPMSIVVQSTSSPQRGGIARSTATVSAATGPHWKLLVTHPSGSLDAAVGATRRKNLLISSSILAVLGASMGLLVLSTRRAHHLARQQMEFVATVSHELRTPLTVIRSAAENLADGVVASEAQIRQYGELMRTEGRRLTEMVEQILEFAGIQSGQRRFAMRPVALDPLLRELVAGATALIPDLTVEVSIPPDLPLVAGEETALRRVFQNLIANAVKYGADTGWVGVRARREGSLVAITIADRGIGIPAVEHARIFEPFYRTPDVVAAQIQGAGLGLSLVQRIVEAHGGRVTVASAPGEGSEFTVRLQAAVGREVPADEQASPRELPSSPRDATAYH